MNILPIKFIHPSDKHLIGSDLFNLSKLYHLGFPVAEIIIIYPPKSEIKHLLNHNIYSNNLNRDHLEKLWEKMENLVLPEDFNLKINIWKELINTWINEFKKELAKNKTLIGSIDSLRPQAIVFAEKVVAKGRAYIKPHPEIKKDSEILIDHGILTPKQLKELDKLVFELEEKLIFPHIYYWILDQEENTYKLKIYKIKESHIFDDLQVKDEISLSTLIKNDQIDLPKIHLKFFFEQEDNFSIDGNAQGVIFNSENIKDVERKIVLLSELATSLKHAEIIFKLGDYIDTKLGIRGTFRLIDSISLLKKEIDVFNFVRNKKRLFNVSVAIPYVRSVDEFLEMKRDLAVAGISRKGSLKFWLEIAVPENLINLEDYLTAGFDGAIINLDFLAENLGGFSLSEEELSGYKSNSKYLVEFLKSPIKLMQKNKIKIITKGSLIQNSDVLKFLIDVGVYGIGVNLNKMEALKEEVFFHQPKILT
ncbi:hypothetical protein HYS91_05490 [Candidatus Daviesbacteria bacterium]|nr:hypothetical protein [Candidatus Daviesbacteria bacterium]